MVIWPEEVLSEAKQCNEKHTCTLLTVLSRASLSFVTCLSLNEMSINSSFNAPIAALWTWEQESGSTNYNNIQIQFLT